MNLFFYVTTKGENQARARHFFREMSCAKISLVGDFQWKAVQESLRPEWTNFSYTSESWASEIKRMDLGSGITNLTSLRTSSSRELRNKPKQDLNQKNLHTHGPTGTVAGGAHIAPLFMCFFFASLYYWGLST
jgi:hypothetical protein